MLYIPEGGVKGSLASRSEDPLFILPTERTITFKGKQTSGKRRRLLACNVLETRSIDSIIFLEGLSVDRGRTGGSAREPDKLLAIKNERQGSGM